MLSRNLCIVAGPEGFYASIYGLVLGPRRDTKSEAQTDLDHSLLVETGGCAAVPHLWRIMQ